VSDNTSATGGYLSPKVGGSIEGLALRRAIGAALAGVSGLDPTLVRPAFQPDPPPSPSILTDWIAFYIQDCIPDSHGYIAQKTDTSATLIRHEDIEVLVSSYGPNCFITTNTLREGFEIAQNSEELAQNGLVFVNCGDATYVPELINERYYERVDIVLTLRHEINRFYPILPFDDIKIDIENS
jgi:hypothetical protein